MSFYLKPTTGYISFQNLEAIAVTRLNFLLNVHRARNNQVDILDIVNRSESVRESGCLIGGSQKDNISHFILRLLLGGDPESQCFLIAAETSLFAFRFSCMTETEMCRLLKSVEHYCISHGIISHESRNFNEMSAKYLLSLIVSIRDYCASWKAVARKYIQGCHDSNFWLPFQAVSMLVSKREVTLSCGLARIPFYKLSDVLTELFRKLLAGSFAGAARRLQRRDLLDSRIRKLQQLLKAIFRRGNVNSGCVGAVCVLHAQQVDAASDRFPPCMKHLHQVLRQKHRLRHQDRIEYTLFLKEAGMPLHQALMFWRDEYSHDVLHNNGCRHRWDREGPRYTYSIRHLYGLEGSRINYRSHCCSSIQERLVGAGEDGGCPFVQFDDDHLRTFLSASAISQRRQSEMIGLRSEGRPTASCLVYLACVGRALQDTGGRLCVDTDSSSSGQRCVGTDSSTSRQRCADTDNSTSRHRCVDTDRATSRQRCVDTDSSTSRHRCVDTDRATSRQRCVDTDSSTFRQRCVDTDNSSSSSQKCVDIENSSSRQKCVDTDNSSSSQRCVDNDNSSCSQRCVDTDNSSSRQKCVDTDNSSSSQKCVDTDNSTYLRSVQCLAFGGCADLSLSDSCTDSTGFEQCTDSCCCFDHEFRPSFTTSRTRGNKEVRDCPVCTDHLSTIHKPLDYYAHLHRLGGDEASHGFTSSHTE